MPALPLSPQQRADAQTLAEAIHAATAADIDAIAGTLVATDDADLFGATEFKLRDLALKIAARALEQHLARKKTAIRGPA